MTVHSLVRRILAKLPAFTITDVAPPGAHTAGRVLGVYSPDRPDEMLVITDQSVMALNGDEWREVLFGDIVSVRSPSDKEQGTAIEVTLSNGLIATLTVSANRGRFRDVYEIARFLDRARAAITA
jgi:hypothetical protein